MVFPMTGRISTRKNDVGIFKYEARWIPFCIWYFGSYYQMLSHAERIFMDSFIYLWGAASLNSMKKPEETGWSRIWSRSMLQFLTHKIPAVFSLIPSCVILWHRAGGVLKRKTTDVITAAREIDTVNPGCNKTKARRRRCLMVPVQRAFTDANMLRSVLCFLQNWHKHHFQ